VRISDNSESMLQARFAARAGIDHARELLRGLKFDDVLQGPDLTYDAATIGAARALTFRNLADWNTLRKLTIADPTNDLNAVGDDGLLNASGTTLVPKNGIALSTGGIVTSRYFLKVTDNNTEAAETAKDPNDNPFHDGDGTIIVRSMGVAKTLVDGSGASTRRNSVAIYEARFMQGSPFSDLGSPAVVIGSNISANFSGNAFKIIGNGSGPGIGAIDTNLNDSYDPASILKAATNGKGTISGNCPPPNDNCISDITNTVINDPSRSMLRDPAWLYDFVFNQLPGMADNMITNGSVGGVDLGTSTNPKITYVQGDLNATGGITGAGLLVVTGSCDMGGSIQFDGLVLVIGQGDFWAHGMNRGIYGGLIVANLTLVNGVPAFGLSTMFDIRGNSDISTFDGSLANMGSGLIPLKQVSFREIKNGMD
jgi:hypothetical protein